MLEYFYKHAFSRRSGRVTVFQGRGNSVSVFLKQLRCTGFIRCPLLFLSLMNQWRISSFHKLTSLNKILRLCQTQNLT